MALRYIMRDPSADLVPNSPWNYITKLHYQTTLPNYIIKRLIAYPLFCNVLQRL